MAEYCKLSKELQKRILEDRKNHRENIYAFKDENVCRRLPSKDKANLWRPAFVRDVEKIMNLPYYNRYSDKTQVFSLYKNDDISRRIQHVQLVSRIARNIGSVLGFNLDLIEAISLGHDMGHTPFGHAGEHKLCELYHEYTNRFFNHNIQSARVLDRIFLSNVSLQTLDGIICHNGEIEQKNYINIPYKEFQEYDRRVEECYCKKEANAELVPATLEACVMRIADIIAYLGKDRQDALKIGLIDKSTSFSTQKIGATNAQIINNMIVNIIENSYGKPYICLGEDYYDALSLCKQDNYSLIYGNKEIRTVYEEQINPMMEQMYKKLRSDMLECNQKSVIFTEHINYIERITKGYSGKNVVNHPYKEEPVDSIVVDYISSMTDDYFIDLYKYLFPKSSHAVKYIPYDFEVKL